MAEIIKKITTSEDDKLRDLLNKTDSWYTNSAEHIERARNFLSFLYVDQWDEGIRQQRDRMMLPTMQFNKLVTVIRSIQGEQRENCPSLAVRGIGKKTSQQQVDIVDGLIRQISYDSDADIVYQLTSKNALECGWGAARVIAKYESAEGFNQCLKIMPIIDFQAAFFDPVDISWNKADGDFAGVYTVYSKEYFKKMYPNIKNPESAPSMGSNYYLRWNTRDAIVVAEIYVKEYFTKMLVQLSDGTEMSKKEAEEVLERQGEFLSFNSDAVRMGYQELTIVNERKARDHNIVHTQFVHNEILDETDYQGKLLPIVYFEGDSAMLDGEHIPIPFIQDAIDTQKLINYIGSELAYSLMKSRKETIMATRQQTAGYEEQWKNPDKVQGVLHYNFDRLAGKPDFITPPVFNSQILEAKSSITNDLQEILGRFEEARGQQSNAISGSAIAKRQAANNKPVNVYNDNLARGIRQIGKICLDMIPHIYDTEREIMIMEKNKKSKSVTINQDAGFAFDQEGMPTPMKANDIKSGKYDIEVRVDGSFDAQNASFVDFWLKICTINPALFNYIADLIAQSSGSENAQQISERLKNLVPPNVINQEEGKPPPPPKPDPAMQMQQQKNQLQAKEIDLKGKQLAIDEQRLMMQANQNKSDNYVSLAKAQAEINKVKTQENIARINHASKINRNQNQQNYRRVQWPMN